jgi:hypothetical protein
MYRVISFEKQLGGAAGSWNVYVGAVAKPNTPNAPYCISNELICSVIGRFLWLPVPPAGIISSPNATHPFWFASFDFNLTGNSLPPVDPAKCEAELPELCAGVVLFDVLIGNSDRHPGNLSVDLLSSPKQMNVFDHSHALCGAQAGNGKQHLLDSQDKLATGGHCLLKVLSTDEHFRKWIDRIKVIPDFLIEEAAEEASAYGLTPEESSQVARFLKHRRDNIEEIIKANRAEFAGITMWSLL